MYEVKTRAIEEPIPLAVDETEDIITCPIMICSLVDRVSLCGISFDLN